MNPGTDAADQIFRMTLEGTEVALKLSGKALKNLAVLLYTILSQHKRNKGRIRLEAMLKTGKPLKLFSISEADAKTFAQEAKRYGILYTAIRTKDGTIDFIVKAEDAERINYIVEKFGLSSVIEKASVETEIISEKEKDIAEPSSEDILMDELFKDEKAEPIVALSEDELMSELFGEEIDSAAQEVQSYESDLEPDLDDLEMTSDSSVQETAASEKSAEICIADPMKNEADLVDIDVADPVKDEAAFEYTIENKRESLPTAELAETELDLAEELEIEMDSREEISSLSPLTSPAQERRSPENPTKSGIESTPSGLTSKTQKQSGNSPENKSVRDSIRSIKKERSANPPVQIPKTHSSPSKGR